MEVADAAIVLYSAASISDFAEHALSETRKATLQCVGASRAAITRSKANLRGTSRAIPPIATARSHPAPGCEPIRSQAEFSGLVETRQDLFEIDIAMSEDRKTVELTLPVMTRAQKMTAAQLSELLSHLTWVSQSLPPNSR